MATFSTVGQFTSLDVEYSPGAGRIRVSSDTADLLFFLDGSQAVKLRDDLSRAIVEAAQASAKAKAAESEGSPA